MKNLLLCFVLLSTSMIFAQKATIRGIVKDASNGESVIFASVALVGTDFATSTNESGIFGFSGLEKGSYTVKIVAVGYAIYEQKVEITNANEIKDLKVELTTEEGIEELGEFTINAESEERKNNTKVSVVSITPREISLVPSPSGDKDLATYLQVLPGVVFTGDQGGQLYIRGGSPIQNLVLLDGMTIFNPFHSIGFFSVFDTDIIASADIYTGGFGAEYGGRISSVMDVTTREGNSKRFSGTASASPFMGKLLLEGPMKKATKESPMAATFMLTGKKSYIEESSKALYSYANEDGVLPFNFTDLYGKISLLADNGSKVNFYGFSFNDQVNYESISKLAWNSWGAGANFTLVPGTAPMIMKGIFAYSKYDIGLQEQSLFDRNSNISNFNFGMSFTSFMKNGEVEYGLQGSGGASELNITNFTGAQVSEKNNNTEFAAYVKVKAKVKRFLIIEPSVRIQYYSSLSLLSPEPRLSLKYNITEKVRFKMAGGLYTQSLIAANSDRDVVNLFYGFIQNPESVADDYLDQKGNEQTLKSNAQRAVHAIGGFEVDVNDKFTINIEGYYKQFRQLFNINRNKIYQDNQNTSDKPDALKKDYIVETGDAYGLDVVLKYTTKKWYVWGVYSLGQVRRFENGEYYAPVFDRRHNVNLVVAYKFGKEESWEASIRWNFGSGLPFTPTQGFYGQETLANDGLNTDYSTSNQTLTVHYGELNSKRLLDYHRLDASITKKIKFTERVGMEVSAGVTNMYNRNNVFYIERFTNKEIYQLPIMPSISANLKF